MKTELRIVVSGLLFLLASSLNSAAQASSVNSSPAATTPTSSDTLHRQIDRLLLEDAVIAATKTEKKAATSPTDFSEQAVTLEPYEVQADKLPLLSSPRESTVEYFFRTGTIAEHVGKKVTTLFWAEGDKGLMLSVSW